MWYVTQLYSSHVYVSLVSYSWIISLSMVAHGNVQTINYKHISGKSEIRSNRNTTANSIGLNLA